MSLKDFRAFVYTNELLEKDSFDKILNLVGEDTNHGNLISQIMEDELRHHGMAKKHFLFYYPALQPWQLRLYRKRESIKNFGRKFYDKNLKFLEKVFTPIYNIVAHMIAKIILLLNLNEFDRQDKNLMDINSRSIL